MPTESVQPNFQIVPPIILNDDADVQAYPSVEAVIRQVEVIDILKQEYEFHDSTGRVLEARVYKKKVSLMPTSTVEADSAVLRGYMVQALRLRGVKEERPSSANFGDLARFLLEEFEKKK